MGSEYIPVLNTIITSIISLLVACGTWNISMKQIRKKEHDDIIKVLNDQKEESAREIRSLQDDITGINSTVQQQIAIIEVKIDTLSSRVEKHNQVIDRTFALEKTTAIHEEQIKNIDGVDSVNYGETMVNRFLQAFKIITKGTMFAVVALIIVTVFLIINTIKLTIFSRKREISIMRLVGASNFTIKMPFVIEGMVLGLIGSIIPIILIIYGYFGAYNHFDGQLYSPLIKLIEPEPFIYWLSGIVLIIGIVVGMFGSYRAVKKYLKV